MLSGLGAESARASCPSVMTPGGGVGRPLHEDCLDVNVGVDVVNV